jgi:hypothetical protein
MFGLKKISAVVVVALSTALYQAPFSPKYKNPLLCGYFGHQWCENDIQASDAATKMINI